MLIKIRERKLAPDYLVSLKHIPASDRPELNEDTKALHISAFTTHRTLERSTLIRRSYPVLHDAVKNIGSVQIRNTATFGGNLVNAVPSSDGAIPLIVLDAVAHIYGTKGERTIDLIHFFLGPGQTVLEKGEILTGIVVPKLLPRTGSAYIKFGRRQAMELPLLGVGMLLSLDMDMTTCAKVRIGLGVAAPTPIRAFNAERFLKGREVTDDTLAEAGRIAADEARVRDSIRGVAWYRRELVGVLVKRMGKKCLERIADEKGGA
jgi:carbon-monoxide dehydrogenase medium subunit